MGSVMGWYMGCLGVRDGLVPGMIGLNLGQDVMLYQHNSMAGSWSEPDGL